jgi:hypothetical protein
VNLEVIHTKIFENSSIKNMLNFDFIKSFKSKVCILNHIINRKLYSIKSNFYTPFFIYKNDISYLSLSKKKHIQAEVCKEFSDFVFEIETEKIFHKRKNIGF